MQTFEKPELKDSRARLDVSDATEEMKRKIHDKDGPQWIHSCLCLLADNWKAIGPCLISMQKRLTVHLVLRLRGDKVR